MKGTLVLAALTAALALSLLGCGGAAIGDLRTITLSTTPSTNLVGEGGTVQMFATGVYSTGTQKDLTSRVKFVITASPGSTDDTGAPLQASPNTVTLNSTGLLTAVAPFVCTWVDTTPANSTPTWFISGSYQVTASFGGVTSQPVFITVASQASSTNPKGNCGP